MALSNLTDQLVVFRRQDLSPTEKLVALAALSFRNADTGRCDPPIESDDQERETLRTRTGYTKQCITKTLASLEAKGLITVKKRTARPSEITFTVNDVYGKRGLPSTTVTSRVNDVDGKGKRRLPITDKEQIKNRQEEFSREMRFSDRGADTSVWGANQKLEEVKKQKTSFCTTDRPDDVEPNLWSDFVTHRKAKRAPVTDTVIKRMRAAAAECQMTLAQAMEMTVVRGWQGFEARYVQKDRKTTYAGGGSAQQQVPDHLNPHIHFDEDYYKDAFNPDGTLNWRKKS